MGKKKTKKTDVADIRLQMQVMDSWKEYASILKSADKEVMDQFQKATRNIQSMVWVSVVMGVIVFIAAIGAIIFGVNETLQQDLEKDAILFEIEEMVQQNLEKDAIISGVEDALQQDSNHIGVSIAVIGLIVLLIILFRNPLKGVQRSLSNLTKTQIIFHGYVRQVIQIDTTYKQTIFSDEPIDLKEMLKAIYNIQEAVEQSVDEVSRSMEE